MADFTIPLTYPGDRWRCPETGIVVAKDLEGNADQRMKWWQYGDASPEQAAELLSYCERSFLLWLDLFGWCLEFIQATGAGNISHEQPVELPFIAWPIHERTSKALQTARAAGRAIALEKARDMGATWLCLHYIVWDCLFHPRANWLIISRKEEEVWFPGAPKALFSKIQFIIGHLPEWMRAPYELRERHMHFGHNEASITGESTNSYVGVGDRVTGIFVDEAAAIDILRSIISNTSDTGPFRIYNSTNRAGSYFTTHLLPSGRVQIAQMPWWSHPAKGVGRRIETDEHGDEKITSDWYVAEAAKRDSTDIAENMDMDRRGAGSAVFDPRIIAAQKRHVPAAPLFGNVVLPEEVDQDASPALWPLNAAEWRDTSEKAAKWRWYGDLVLDDRDRMRPDQSHAFAFGVDVGRGTGASPSTITCVDADTGWKVGRWLCNRTSPDDLAAVLLLAGHWVGGRTGVPLAVVEANGSGMNTLLRLKRLGYDRIYCHTDDGRVSSTESDKLGWHSTRPGKATMLHEYEASMKQGRFRNPDEEALDEALTYIHYEQGGCGPSTLAGVPEEERARHGDLVIADMLADLGRRKIPRVKSEHVKPPPGSYGDRMAKWEAKRKAIKDAVGGKR